MLILLPVLATLSCPDPVPVFGDGVSVASICAAAAPMAGLTVIDLSPDWTPAALAAGPDGAAPAYRATYLALARGNLKGAGEEGARAAADRGLEVFGFVPTLDLVATRLGDEARHQCHAAIDDTALLAMTKDPREEYGDAARGRVRATARLRAALERLQAKRKLPDLAALAASDRQQARQVARLATAEQHLSAIRATQAHLACDGLLPAKQIDGRYTWQTSLAVLAFQRRSQLVPRQRLDADTRALLAEDSRVIDHRTALRALRERVVEATGLIEDGSAGEGNLPVLGQPLGAPAFGQVIGHAPLPGAAPDLIGMATEAAARALGWTDPAATAVALRRAPARVAVQLPPLPRYHGAHMELAVEIDRGDIWYDARPRSHHVARRPALVVYARDGGARIPLVRWPTTIGGWKKELRGRREIDQFMESPAGPRVWREMYVAPAWLPPNTTPDRELVRSVAGTHTLRSDLVGPSYRSAYGLLMLIHEKQVATRRGVRRLDERVRSHGSGSIASIFDGESHGCHRLPPFLALRLGGFLLEHRTHVRHGDVRTSFARTVRYRGRFPFRITTRGYRVELTPPVPIEVLPGTIRSARKTPPPVR